MSDHTPHPSRALGGSDTGLHRAPRAGLRSHRVYYSLCSTLHEACDLVGLGSEYAGRLERRLAHQLEAWGDDRLRWLRIPVVFDEGLPLLDRFTLGSRRIEVPRSERILPGGIRVDDEGCLVLTTLVDGVRDAPVLGVDDDGVPHVFPVNNDADLETAVEVIDRLWDAPRGTVEANVRDVMAQLIVAYEDRNGPTIADIAQRKTDL